MDSRRKASLLLGSLFALLIVCLVALAGLTGLLRPLYDPQGTMEPISSIGGPIRLMSHTEQRIDTATEGKPFAVFFGFTHCPDVCPTTLSEMTQTLTELGDKAKNLRIYFVSVDPERDTPQILASYMGSFDNRMIGLTGSRDEIDAVIRAYRVYARKVPTKDGDYTMDHTATTYLMDGKGRLVGTLAYQEDAKVRLEKIQRLLRGA
jgi:protein SCO1/2